MGIHDSHIQLTLKKALCKLQQISWEFQYLDRNDDLYEVKVLGLQTLQEKIFSDVGFLLYTLVMKNNISKINFSDILEIQSHFEEEIQDISKLVDRKPWVG